MQVLSEGIDLGVIVLMNERDSAFRRNLSNLTKILALVSGS